MCTTNGERRQDGGSCNHNQNSGNSDNSGNSNENLYPRLSDLFQQFMGAPENDGSTPRRDSDNMSREQAGDLLRDILANMVYGDQRPSAPPAAADGTPAGGWQSPPPVRADHDDCGEWFRRTFRARQCPTCHQHSNLPTTILSSFGRNIFTALTMLIPILVMPRIFLALGLYVFALRSLGWPLRKFVAAAFVFFVLMQLESTLITIVALAAVFKVCVVGRPLLDRQHWNARLGV